MDDVEIIDDRTARSVEVSGEASGKLLKRRETARELGVSESTVRRMEGATLTPIVGADGVHRFREEQVRELTIRRVHLGPADPSSYNGALAAEVFSLLDDGLTPIEIVKRTKQDPRAIAALRVQYAALQGGFVVTSADLSEIEALPWLMGSFPVESGAQLVENLRSSAPDACTICKLHDPKVCPPCAKRLALKRAAALSLSTSTQTEKVNGQKRQAQLRRDALNATETGAAKAPSRSGSKQ